MSKKSRRRNRRLLKALGAGLAVAGLGRAFSNRNRADSIAANEAKEAGFDIPVVKNTPEENTFKVQDVTTPKVYQDAIMRGDKGTKFVKPDLKFGEVVTKSGEKKTIKPFKSAGLKFGIGNGEGLTETQKAVNRANKEMSQGKLPPQLRAPGRTNITTGQGKFRQDLKDFANFMFPKLNLKSGGRVKKRTGAAKRGFGRAFKGGK